MGPYWRFFSLGKPNTLRNSLAMTIDFSILKVTRDIAELKVLIFLSAISGSTYLLQVRGSFWPVPYLAFPLYLNCATGNGTETRYTIFAGDYYHRQALFKNAHYDSSFIMMKITQLRSDTRLHHLNLKLLNYRLYGE